jgi:hypothetical protein
MNKALVWLAIIVVSWVAVIKLVTFLFHLIPLVIVVGLVAVVGWLIWKMRRVDNPNKDFK